MNEQAGAGWRFWVDRGGTFTDIVARRPDGRLETLKLLSEAPEHYADAGIEGMRRMLGLPDAAALAEAPIEVVRMGTTVATNALLERRGEPTVLVVTRGCGDVLRIGTQQRPELFALDIRLPEPLYAEVIEADERLAADGMVLRPLDENALATALRAARARGFRAAAVVLLHGYRFPAHELAAARLAREAGFEQVSVSHEVSPLPRIVPRGETTVADAYLSPVLDRYVARLRQPLGGHRLLFMQSNGGLAEAERFRGRDSVLSGPAGGVVGMAAAGRRAGIERLIGFDMGGTSTDVCLYEGEFERSQDNLVAGVRLQAPMLRIHTVAAGGGSVLAFRDGRFQVGPESAGAQPGPACYGLGGPAAVTDANLVLGRLQPEALPRVFGRSGDQPLDRAAAAARLEEITAAVAAAGRPAMSIEAAAAGFLEVAVERMARAVKQVSVRRGADPGAFTLCGFGGAAGQHACDVADALNIRRVLLPPFAGVLSAWGIGLADLVALRQAPVQQPLDAATLARAHDTLAQLGREAAAELVAQGLAAQRCLLSARLRLRCIGSDTVLEVPLGTESEVRAVFATAFERRFGFHADAALVLESVEAEARGGHGEPGRAPAVEPAPRSSCRAWVDGTWREVPLVPRQALAPGEKLAGPALLPERNATTWLSPGWHARVDGDGNLLLERAARRRARKVSTAADPVLLEVFNNRFMHVAEDMGAVLQNTASSVNIKERLDYSCAVFDATGGLVANAPHMPVHLGSMGESVRAVMRSFGDAMSPGDSFVLNDPYEGGTHLPDITVVTPFCGDDGRPALYVASRAHHADIGGRTPGSMPADSHHIDEEGVLLTPERIVTAGRFDEDAVLALLGQGRWPARNPRQNLADLKAQLAANRRGLAGLEKMRAEFGPAVVRAYMGHIQRNAAEAVAEALAGLQDGTFRWRGDGGEEICVAIRIDRVARRAVIDFSGTSPQSPGNLNAPAAVCRAAVLYVFRCLVKRDIPLNEGCLEPLELRIPEGSLLNPRWPAAVAGGNVETSQSVVDALFGALGVVAASQGTMNNLSFGNAGHQYYETLCGGAGAGPGFAGASAVHTHMTNSRLTDPEILELRHPVRVELFAVRRGSGGAGRWRGGDGVIRRLLFNEGMTAALISNRRRHGPFGLAGGSCGAPGVNRVIRRDGSIEVLPGIVELGLEPGDQLEIMTPGGGGFGASS
ncbi:hydantoinase B/oxoprolinase family protein [Thioalkalivibrio sp. XN279]|uniref:hydantoinase B/oxoprolinase family protein n=1 Tax=Thioalkalivibrio sp. XN279 TaxID=2714953 RepID=UPI00140AD19B|nr:hydantoinase B/oxoprolinase family protein [Thioalkalivibrio sp. XN279]NHA13422.1 5-oxoprolinase [Thioalkalivibrio sp. XN279]